MNLRKRSRDPKRSNIFTGKYALSKYTDVLTHGNSVYVTLNEYHKRYYERFRLSLFREWSKEHGGWYEKRHPVIYEFEIDTPSSLYNNSDYILDCPKLVHVELPVLWFISYLYIINMQSIPPFLFLFYNDGIIIIPYDELPGNVLVACDEKARKKIRSCELFMNAIDNPRKYQIIWSFLKCIYESYDHYDLDYRIFLMIYLILAL